MRIQSYPPTFGCEEWVIPILLLAIRNAIRDGLLRAINANRCVCCLSRPTHDLLDIFTVISNVDLTKAAIPTVSLPEKECSDRVALLIDVFFVARIIHHKASPANSLYCGVCGFSKGACHVLTGAAIASNMDP